MNNSILLRILKFYSRIRVNNVLRFLWKAFLLILFMNVLKNIFHVLKYSKVTSFWRVFDWIFAFDRIILLRIYLQYIMANFRYLIVWLFTTYLSFKLLRRIFWNLGLKLNSFFSLCGCLVILVVLLILY